MRIISFSLTTRQFRTQTKFVTRRLGWETLKKGELLCGVEKAQGLKKGEKVKRLGIIRVAEVRRERLDQMTRKPAYGWTECVLEGFPRFRPVQFVEMFCRANNCKPSRAITRIKFEYV